MKMRKITVEVPEDLYLRAVKETGEGATATVRRGLELVAASSAYDEMRRLRGKVKFETSLATVRNDRR
jgi:hypothetical protein